MSLRFVLDENVLEFALSAAESDAIGAESARLLQVLWQRCEHQLVRTPLLFASYSRKAQSVIPTTLGMTARRRFFSLVNDGSKLVMVDDLDLPPAECDLSGVKDDDLPFASAALAAEAILVTEDKPLREALGKSSCGVETADTAGAVRAILGTGSA